MLLEETLLFPTIYKCQGAQQSITLEIWLMILKFNHGPFKMQCILCQWAIQISKWIPGFYNKYFKLFLMESFFFLIIFNRRIIALQYCVSFCHPSTWISHNYTYICFLLNLPLTSNSNPTLVGCHRAPGWAPYGIHQPHTGHLFYKKSTTTNTRQDAEKREHFCTVGENVSWCNHYGEEDYFKN